MSTADESSGGINKWNPENCEKQVKIPRKIVNFVEKPNKNREKVVKKRKNIEKHPTKKDKNNTKKSSKISKQHTSFPQNKQK